MSESRRRIIRLTAPAAFHGAKVARLHVSLGDRMAVGDVVADIELDLATVGIPSDASGIVAELAASEGQAVGYGSPLVVLVMP